MVRWLTDDQGWRLMCSMKFCAGCAYLKHGLPRSQQQGVCGYLQGIFWNGVLEGRQISDILVMKPFHFEVQVHVLRALAQSVFFMLCKKIKTRRIRWQECTTVHISHAEETCIPEVLITPVKIRQCVQCALRGGVSKSILDIFRTWSTIIMACWAKKENSLTWNVYLWKITKQAYTHTPTHRSK